MHIFEGQLHSALSAIYLLEHVDTGHESQARQEQASDQDANPPGRVKLVRASQPLYASKSSETWATHSIVNHAVRRRSGCLQ
jgi:hypothetical protein